MRRAGAAIPRRSARSSTPATQPSSVPCAAVATATPRTSRQCAREDAAPVDSRCDADARSLRGSPSRRIGRVARNSSAMILRPVEHANTLATIISLAKKSAIVFSCTECGGQSPKWLGRCPDCNAWNSYAQEDAPTVRPATAMSASAAPVPIDAIETDLTPRLSTNIPSLDRVLVGDLVEGAVILVGS